jgi:hypothetical protein
MKTLKSLAILVCFGALMFTSNLKAAGSDQKTNTVIAQEQAPTAPQTATPSTSSQPSNSQSTDSNATSSAGQQSTDQQSTTSNSNLPQTASDLPLVAAIGILALAAFASVRMLLKVTGLGRYTNAAPGAKIRRQAYPFTTACPRAPAVWLSASVHSLAPILFT